MWNRTLDPQVTRVFTRIVREQIGLKEGEQVLIAADSATEPETLSALATAINAAGGVFTIAIQPDAGWAGKDLYALTGPMREAYVGADVVVAATQSSSAALYGRPQPFRDLMERKEKVRLFSLAERPFEVIVADTANYYEIKRNNERLKEIFQKGRVARITNRAGTDFRGGLDDIPWDRLWHHLSHEGFSLGPGEFGACPDGETHVPPPPESMEGTLVVDGPIANICDMRPDEPVRITVKAGRTLKIEGGRDAHRLDRFVREIEQDYVAEIGLGTNPKWIVSKSLHAVKKGLGNVHVAYGGWWGFQPKIPYKIHGDMVMYDGTVEVDGRVIMANGQLFLE
jgi:leucyl aminopeptidase (aminopeptidase T)